MMPIRYSIPAIAVVSLALGCNHQALSPEQQKVVGTWILVKPSDHGTVSRELVFHPDGFTFTTTCRSVYDNAVADGKGEGTWTIRKGMVQAKWIEKQTVGQHTQEMEYGTPFQIDASNGEVLLINVSNQDQYKRK